MKKNTIHKSKNGVDWISDNENKHKNLHHIFHDDDDDLLNTRSLFIINIIYDDDNNSLNDEEYHKDDTINSESYSLIKRNFGDNKKIIKLQ